jgi:hypothetical protein
MRLDIHAAVVTTIVLVILGAFASLWAGIRTIRAGRRISFFRIRTQRVSLGWRMVFLAFCLAAFAYAISRYGEPVAFRYFPPSQTFTRTPTISQTPTISLTPSITETPTITPTPAISYTPTPSYTPFLPQQILVQFNSTVTPNPDSVFSHLLFSPHIQSYQAVNPATVFQNPVGRMFASFSYDKMVNGSQWTVLWYRDGTLVHAETGPWSGGSGGYGYTGWSPSPDQWLPGIYQVQIFVGMEWKSIGQFLVQGEPATLTPTRTATFTLTPSITLTPSLTYTLPLTPRPTWTPLPSDTRWPTATTAR